jgi:hypothetical protein
MPAYVLHQNMRRFYSGLGVRSRRLLAYLGQPVPPAPEPPFMPVSWPAGLAPGSYGFAEIAATMGGPVPLSATLPAPRRPICMVGFTELFVPGTRSIAMIAAQLTGAGLGGQVNTFRCGRTVGMDHEFVGIATAGWVTVHAYGRVAIWMDELINEYVLPPFPPRWRRETPEIYSGDYRWLIYAVLQLDPLGPRIAVGFLHNTYTLDTKSVTSGRIEAMAQRIKSEAALAVQHVIVGGDFNAPPRDPLARNPLYDYAEGPVTSRFMGADLTPKNWYDGRWLAGTTWAGSLYDYWRSDIDPATKVELAPGGVQRMQPSVSSANWDGPHGLMSDHAATLLRIV